MQTLLISGLESEPSSAMTIGEWDESKSDDGAEVLDATGSDGESRIEIMDSGGLGLGGLRG